MKAAEKYAELEAAGQPRPRCKRHGEEMVWKQRVTRWLCVVKRREYERRALQNPATYRHKEQHSGNSEYYRVRYLRVVRARIPAKKARIALLEDELETLLLGLRNA